MKLFQNASYGRVDFGASSNVIDEPEYENAPSDVVLTVSSQRKLFGFSSAL
jgi:hypothetical protein